MTAKRALIVDDSKSARVVLSRLLEKHQLAVDSTDSAEAALAYLREHRPDVIFMDQVMSGMDGLRAVQVIKSDPSTAAIPIMMYTSQDGELYAGEARALGAVGVLPKRMAPADIAGALYALRLLPERRAARTFDRVELPATGTGVVDGVLVRAADAGNGPAAVGATAAPAELRETLEPLLQEQGAELRRFVLASLESMSARVVSDITARVATAVAATLPAAPPAAPVTELAPEPPPPVAARSRRPIAVAVLCGVLALAGGIFGWFEHGARGAAAQRLDATAHELAAARRELAAAQLSAARVTERLPVPYGEAALAGTRLTALAVLLADLEAQRFKGTVAVTTAAGDFCLTGNPAEGFGLAPGEMPANRCDVVGNPFDESLAAAERDPPALAALVAGVRERSGGAIGVRVVHLGRARDAGVYPSAPETSAAQWNAVAGGRNFVEFAVAPSAS